MKSFSNETLNFFFRKFWASYILDLALTVPALRILSQKCTRSSFIPKFLVHFCDKIRRAQYLPRNVMVRLPHPRSGNSQGQGTFSAPRGDKQTRNYDTECSDHHPSQSP